MNGEEKTRYERKLYSLPMKICACKMFSLTRKLQKQCFLCQKGTHLFILTIEESVTDEAKPSRRLLPLNEGRKI